MSWCPACRSEYVEGVARCSPCDVELVEALPEALPEKGELLRAAVASGEALAIARASYTDACQMVEALHAAGVDAMVSGDPASCGKGGQCSHYFVAVLQEDGKAANDALKAEWARLLDHEQMAAAGGEIDLDAEGAKQCPACTATFEGAPDECPDCGLYLGVA